MNTIGLQRNSPNDEKLSLRPGQRRSGCDKSTKEMIPVSDGSLDQVVRIICNALCCHASRLLGRYDFTYLCYRLAKLCINLMESTSSLPLEQWQA